MKNKKLASFCGITFLLLFSFQLRGQNSPDPYWSISGRREIQLNLDKEGALPYSDNIEMAGKRVAAIVSYSSKL